jgi:hypothetical protein
MLIGCDRTKTCENLTSLGFGCLILTLIYRWSLRPNLVPRVFAPQAERPWVRGWLRPRLHGTGWIWDRSEIWPFRPCKLGLYRLCSATCEQLLEFWATFSLSSNLEQLLLSGATFDCLSTKWATFNLFKHIMNIWGYKKIKSNI